MTAYGYLGLAITSEIVGTTMLRSTANFSRPLPSIAVAALYAASFYLLSRAIQDLPVGTAYAVWAGVGTAAIAVIGAVALGDGLTVVRGIGLVAIVAGVVLVNLGGLKSA